MDNKELLFYKSKYGDAIFLAWIQLTIGYCSNIATQIALKYKDASEFVCNQEEWAKYTFTNFQKEQMEKVTLKMAAYLLDETIKQKIAIITIKSSYYPKKLKALKNAPIVIYVKGNFNCIKNLDSCLSLAMVGTRKATKLGSQCALEYARALANANAVIVSGGAAGIDSVCHTGAVDKDGATVVVLGHGIGYPYLKKFNTLRNLIMKKGAIISEYLIDTPSLDYRFPQRNRIIAALSDGVLVVEAGVKSGSLITAKDAIKLGRKVFALSNFDKEPTFKGSRKLVEDGLASYCYCPMDILKEFRDKNYDINYEGSTAKIVYDNVDVDYIYQNVIKVVRKNKSLINIEDEENVNNIDTIKNSVAIFKGNDYNEINNITQKENIVQKTSKKPEQNKAQKQKEIDLSMLSPQSKEVYNCIEYENMLLDDIIVKSGKDMSKVISSITELELLGFIKSDSGKRYKRV